MSYLRERARRGEETVGGDDGYHDDRRAGERPTAADRPVGVDVRAVVAQLRVAVDAQPEHDLKHDVTSKPKMHSPNMIWNTDMQPT